jgi:hypothetical protein
MRNKQQFIRTLKNYKLYTIFRILIVKDFLSTYGKEKLQDKQLIEKFLNYQIAWYYSNEPTRRIVEKLKGQQQIYNKYLKINIQKFGL